MFKLGRRGEKQCLVEWKEKALHRQFLRKTESTDDRNR